MEARPIRFVHRGQVVSVAHAEPTRNVLHWLREDARCTGSKEGCAEGDCGACTVWVAELASEATPARTRVGELSVRPVNACIRFLPALDGKYLLTVEDLGGHHPAQQAMVQCHGSQCGFCTPGFVMTLAERYEHHVACGTRPTREQLAHDLAGNLCRCTGYRPILDAGERMFGTGQTAAASQLNTTEVATLLRELRSDPPLDYQTHGQRYSAPRSLQALAEARQERPQARLVAGSTDMGLWVNKQFRALPDLISLNEVVELKAVHEAKGELHIGAAVPLQDAFHALTERVPAMREAALRFAGPPVRHAGTLGGNIANGSPIGDGAPMLMALGARLVLGSPRGTRELALDTFYLDYMKNRLQPDEWLQTMVVPLPPAQRQVRAWKLSKRFDCDISSLFGAFALELRGERVAHVRLAFGGMAATVRLASHAQAAMLGQPWNEATLRAAQAALATDFTPLSDLRASASHRLLAAAGLLERLWLQTRAHSPLAMQDTTVWPTAAASTEATP